VDCCFRAGGPEHVEVRAQAGVRRDSESQVHKSGPASENDVQVQIREVEVLVLVMSFALLSASSTWTWVCLKNDGFFDGDQVWDQELFTSRGMQFYEILYGFEIYSLVFSLLSIAGDPVSIEDVSLTTLSVTLSLLYRSQLIFRDQNYVSNAINFVCVYTPCLYTQYT
jgi:hypothetical protein